MTAPAAPGPHLHVKTAHSETGAWIVIQGEADAANLDELEAALASIELDGQKAVNLDLSELSFIDVAALRQLTSFAMRMRQSGHDVTTSGAQPLILEVASALKVQDTLGLA
jgi:anti-anti-sigma factor